MKEYQKTLPVQFNFFGRPKSIDKQSFDDKLEELRKQAYATIAVENKRYKIDCAINDIKTLLNDIWSHAEKLAQVASSIRAYIRIDNNYKAYAVAICYENAADQTQYESTESSNFDEAENAEKAEVIAKYGFQKLPDRQYRVTYGNYEAVLSASKLSELRTEHADLHFDVAAI